MGRLGAGGACVCLEGRKRKTARNRVRVKLEADGGETRGGDTSISVRIPHFYLSFTFL